MAKNEDLKAFDAWADDYLKRQYPFYTADAIVDVCRALKSQLYAAWKAGAETRPTVTPNDKKSGLPYSFHTTDGDAERALGTHKEIFEAVLLECLQISWDEHCADTGCFPDDFTLTKGELEFTAGRFASYAAQRMFITNYINDIYRAALQSTRKQMGGDG